MGFFILILFILIFYIGFKWISNIFFGAFTQNESQSTYQLQRERETQEPETQEDRILDFQRKIFESSDAEDVDFEEVK